MIRRHKPIRLKEYDYSQPGAYFVTICTNGHESRFGDAVNEAMRENELQPSCVNVGMTYRTITQMSN